MAEGEEGVWVDGNYVGSPISGAGGGGGGG